MHVYCIRRHVKSAQDKSAQTKARRQKRAATNARKTNARSQKRARTAEKAANNSSFNKSFLSSTLLINVLQKKETLYVIVMEIFCMH